MRDDRMTIRRVLVVKNRVNAASHAVVVALLQHVVAVERRWWNVGERVFLGHRLRVILSCNVVPVEQLKV